MTSSPSPTASRTRTTQAPCSSRIEAWHSDIEVCTTPPTNHSKRTEGIYIGWVPEWAAAGFGIGDDNITGDSVILFDWDAENEQWWGLPNLGKHKQNNYNARLVVGEGEQQGTHPLFFGVKLWRKGQIQGPKSG